MTTSSTTTSPTDLNRSQPSTIKAIRTHMVRSPNMAETNNVFRDEALLVEVVSDDGVSGWAETNGLMTAIKAIIDAERPHPRDRGVRVALLDETLDDYERLVRKLRANTMLSGRSGLGRVAVGAVETALADLIGKLERRPAWQVISNRETPVRDEVPAYITIFFRGDFADVVAKSRDAVTRGLEYGYRSFKIEATDYNTDSEQAVTLIEKMREHVGDDIELFVDNVYRWQDLHSALRATRSYQALGVQFLEDPFLPEQYELCRRLYEKTGMPLATGGGTESVAQFLALMDLGNTQIVQPGVHVAGLYGAYEVCQLAEQRNRSVTTFSVCATSLAPAGAVHLANASKAVTYVEYAPAELYPNLILRRDLIGPEPELVDGCFKSPTAPGLGVEMDLDALHRHRIEQ